MDGEDTARHIFKDMRVIIQQIRGKRRRVVNGQPAVVKMRVNNTIVLKLRQGNTVCVQTCHLIGNGLNHLNHQNHLLSLRSWLRPHHLQGTRTNSGPMYTLDGFRHPWSWICLHCFIQSEDHEWHPFHDSTLPT